MKKMLAFVMAICMMALLPACSNRTPASDADNSPDAPVKEEEHIQENEDENIDDEESPALTEFATNNWGFSYDQSVFDVQKDDPLDTVLMLKPDCYTVAADDTVYFSVAFLNRSTAEAAVEREETDSTNGNPMKDILTINGETVHHLHTEWGEDPESTVYDTFYLDVEGGCYVITLCYYIDAAQTWGAEMDEMALSFHLL